MIRQTDHTMPACDPSSCAGAVPARDRLRIVLQYSGERSYNALALRLGLKRSENLYRIRKGYNGISMDLALRIRNICPSLSLSWLLGGEGTPRLPTGLLPRPLLPRPLPPRCSTFRSIPTCSLWTGTFGLGKIGEFRFLPGCVARPRRPFPAAAMRCRPVSCPAIACFSPGRRPSPSCSAELMSSLSGRPGCAGLSARASRRSASGSFR